MREWIFDIILGILLFAFGILIGYTLSKPKPPIDEILSEIKSLQQDVVRLDTRTMETYIHTQHLISWRDSIIFRPPEKEK
jgi:uncharacterized protein YoxC